MQERIDNIIAQIKGLLLVDDTNLIQTGDNDLKIIAPSGCKYMTDILKDLPKGVFIDKQICAVGGTYLSINSPSNYVIAVHRKALVENKFSQNENILIKVDGDVNNKILLDEIKSSGKNKIITTYDSLPRVAKVLSELGILSTYHLIVDEVQNVVREGGDYRAEVCNALLKNTCNFASVSYLTATTTKRKYLPPQINDIPYLTIEWEDGVNIHVDKKHITGDLTEAITSIALEHIDNPSKGEAYFFYNCVKGFIPVIKNLMKLRGITSKDIKIICANTEENVKTLKSLGKGFHPDVPVYGVDKNKLPIIKNKLITFVTKTCFEGSDFYSDNQTSYIVSDAKNKARYYVKTDIVVDIRQIAGRFRQESPMHQQKVVLLWTAQYDGFNMTEEEYEAHIKDEINKHKNLIQYHNEGTIPDDTLELKAKVTKYLTKSDGEIVINPLAYSSLMSEFDTQFQDFKTIVVNGKSIQVGEEKLKDLYDVDDFQLAPLNPSDKFKIGKKLNFKGMAKKYYDAILGNNIVEIELCENLIPSLAEYKDELGIEVFKSCSFQESRIKEKFEASVGVDKLTSSPNKIKKAMKLQIGDWYSLKDCKDKLQCAYDKLKIKEAAKANHMEKFFSVKRCKMNGVVGYKVVES